MPLQSPSFPTSQRPLFVLLRVTIAEAITKAAARLAAREVPDARRDAEVLLGHVLQRDRAWLVAHYPDGLDDRDARVFDSLLERRSAREPLQYLTGSQEFWGLPFRVTHDVLIPRPETELVVEASLVALQGNSAPLVIDLCTGSGCIAVSLAAAVPNGRVFALDRSEAALDVARGNARRNGTATRIRFLAGDLFEPLGELDLAGRVDLVAANPPYIRSDEMASLQPEVRNFEPETALVAGPRGTEIAERILEGAPHYLRSGGALVMEMGLGQADALREMADRSGAYGGIEVRKDLAGIGRVIVATRT
jgi:release factor glutamine methyltransferase